MEIMTGKIKEQEYELIEEIFIDIEELEFIEISEAILSVKSMI